MNLVKSALIGLFMVCGWAPTAQAYPCSDCDDRYSFDLNICDYEKDECIADADWYYDTWVRGAWMACSGTTTTGRPDPTSVGGSLVACAWHAYVLNKYKQKKRACMTELARCEARACDRKDRCELNCDPFEDTH